MKKEVKEEKKKGKKNFCNINTVQSLIVSTTIGSIIGTKRRRNFTLSSSSSSVSFTFILTEMKTRVCLWYKEFNSQVQFLEKWNDECLHKTNTSLRNKLKRHCKESRRRLKIELLMCPHRIGWKWIAWK